MSERKPPIFINHPVGFESARSIGCYRAFCTAVIDGDTFDVFLDLGIGQYAYETIRLYNFDTPEIFHPSNDAEKAHGLAAKARTKELIEGRPLLIRTFKDKQTFGRYVGQTYFFGDGTAQIELARQLGADGFAKLPSY